MFKSEKGIKKIKKKRPKRANAQGNSGPKEETAGTENRMSFLTIKMKSAIILD